MDTQDSWRRKTRRSAQMAGLQWLTVLFLSLYPVRTSGTVLLAPGLPQALDISIALVDPSLEWAVDLPGPIPFLNSTITSLTVKPLISSIFTDSPAVYRIVQVKEARPESGSVLADFITEDEMEMFTQDVICTTKTEEFNVTFGFKIVWTNMTYLTLNSALSLSEMNSFEVMFGLDEKNNMSYVLTKYNDMQLVYHNDGPVSMGSRFRDCGCSDAAHFVMPNSFLSSVGDSFQGSNVNKTGWWLFRTDIFNAEWEVELRSQPVVDISGNLLDTPDDQPQLFTPGSHMIVAVTAPADGLPGPFHYTLSCPAVSYSSSQISESASFNVTVTKSFNNVECSVARSTKGLCNSEEKTFNVEAIYGPIDMIIAQPDGPFLQLCPDMDTNKTFTCSVTTDEVHPSATVVLKVPGLLAEPLDPYSETTEGDETAYHFRFRPPAGGDFTAECHGSNTQANSLTHMATGDFLVWAPPSEHPDVMVTGGPSLSNGSRHYAELGVLDLECSLSGGSPPLNDAIRIHCDDGSDNAAMNSKNVSYNFDVRPSGNETTCRCTATHASNCFSHESIFTVFPVYGPTDLTAGQTDPDFQLCQGEDTNKTFTCSLTTALVHPKASVVLKVPGLLAEPLDPYSETDEGNQTVYHFQFRPPAGGDFTAECHGTNTQFNHLTDMDTIDFQVLAPPSEHPDVMITGGPSLSNGSRHYAELGVLVLECSLSGGSPPWNDAIRIHCDDGSDNAAMNSKNVSYNFAVRPSGNETTCRCTATHASSCFSHESIFTVFPVYGPTDLTAGQTDPDFPLCPGEDTNKTFTCSLTTALVHPKASVVLKVPGLLAEPLDPYSETDEGNQTVYHFQFRPPAGGDFTAECHGTNTQFNHLTDMDAIDFQVFAPPTSDPVITVDGTVVTPGTAVEILFNSTVDIGCSVVGGTPTVSGVNLFCFGEDTTGSQGPQSSIRATVHREHHESICRCNADHPSHCYPKSAEFPVTVKEASTIIGFTANGQSDQITISAGQEVTFLCEVEGIPTADMTITGRDSDNTLVGVETILNHYSHNTRVTKTMACNESDVYVCAAANFVGNGVEKSVTVSVTCQPEVFAPPARFVFYFKPSGRSKVSIKIISRPRPVLFTLFRLFFRTSVRGKRETPVAVLVDVSEYRINFTQVNQQHGNVEVDIFELNPKEKNDYRLDVSNEVGDVLQTPFETIRAAQEQDQEDQSPHSNEQSATVSLIAVSVTAFVVMLSIIAALTVYNKYTSRELKLKRKTLLKEAKRMQQQRYR